MIIWWRISKQAILVVSSWSGKRKVYLQWDMPVLWLSVLLPGIALDVGLHC